MLNPKHWPNLVSGARIALMPAVVAVAMAGSRRWFLALMAVSLATDVLDGYLARRLNAYSELGRKLDSVADYLTMLAGLAGLAWLWPDIVRRELPWIVSGLGAFFSVVVYGFVRLGRAPCYHTWLAKIGVAACVLAMIPLLAGGSAVPFHLVIGLQIITALDEMTIALLVPWHVGEMRSSWHAWRIRRGSTTLLKSAQRARS
jgi:phosphatidylglycerophosphate synthase